MRSIERLCAGKPLLALVLDSVFDVTAEGWRKLTWRWALFFLALAVLNEIVWRTLTTDVWISFKVFGVAPLTFLFAASQYPLLTRYDARTARAQARRTDQPWGAPASVFSICGFTCLAKFSAPSGPTSL